MALRTWQVEKIGYCEHVGHEVALEVEVIYPANELPDSAPRIVAHRCSNAGECNAMDKPACQWCATNPNHSPV